MRTNKEVVKLFIEAECFGKVLFVSLLSLAGSVVLAVEPKVDGWLLIFGWCIIIGFPFLIAHEEYREYKYLLNKLDNEQNIE